MAGLKDLKSQGDRRSGQPTVAPASSAEVARTDLTKGQQPLSPAPHEEQHMETSKKMLSVRISTNLHNDLEQQVVIAKRAYPKLTIQDFMIAMIQTCVENPQIITLIREKIRANRENR